jgi:hypothetical protein
LEALRTFAFAKGRELFRDGSVDTSIKTTHVIGWFQDAHPELAMDLPRSVKNHFVREEWQAAEEKNEISLFTLQRPKSAVC